MAKNLSQKKKNLSKHDDSKTKGKDPKVAPKVEPDKKYPESGPTDSPAGL